jgi:hypothetical protein
VNLPALEDLAADIDADKAKASLDLLEALFAECELSKTVPIAKAAGITSPMFDDDRQVLWRVAEVTARHQLSREGLHSFIRAALKKHRFFDPSQIVGNYGSAQWGDPSIKALLDAMFFSRACIEHYSNRLALICRRQRDATEHLNHARRLLAGEAA